MYSEIEVELIIRKMIRIRCSYILLWLVKDDQTSTSLIQNTMEYFVQDHLRQPKRTQLRENTLTH